MASKSCTSCLRTLQRQLIPQVIAMFPLKSKPDLLLKAQKPASRFTASRSFTTTTTRHKEPPEPNETPRSSIPPVTPERAERTAKLTTPTPASLKVAAEIKKVAGRATETYTAYGSTEILYKECARQADYKIPQAGKDDEEMPKTENGEDLGVGEGWWHTGKLP
jgi:cytochrome b pre-mRNA-processing protein 3